MRPLAGKAKPAAISALLALVSAAGADEMEWNEFDSKLAVDAGHIVRGYSVDPPDSLKFYSLNRNTVTLAQSARYGETWEFDAGFMGIMWWPFTVDGKDPGMRTVRVEPRLSQIKAKAKFGSAGYLEFGLFPYKYNDDATNLGEYLYRSGTYPGIVVNSDGYRLIDFAAFEAYGAHLRFSHWGGKVMHDFNFFAETAIVPVGDITPAYELSLSLPFLEMGAGIACNRLISFAPSKTRPREFKNAYVVVDSSAVDSAYTGPFEGASSAIRNAIESGDTTVRYDASYWTQQGIKVMGRAALDLGFLLPNHLRNPGDLRIYAEAAVLGWEDQPYYYEDRRERMPIMLGMNVPTFKLLDLLSIQTEHYTARFAETTQFYYNARPIWGGVQFKTTVYRRDDRKWSVHAKKSVGKMFRVRAQVANDHLRLRMFKSEVVDMDLTQNPSHWYYVLRFEFGG